MELFIICVGIAFVGLIQSFMIQKLKNELDEAYKQYRDLARKYSRIKNNV